MQFYVADGKYRMQVFALEDLQDGNFTVYCPDVLGEAVGAGVLVPPPVGAAPGGANVYAAGSSGETLRVDRLDKNSLNTADEEKTHWQKRKESRTPPARVG